MRCRRCYRISEFEKQGHILFFIFKHTLKINSYVWRIELRFYDRKGHVYIFELHLCMPWEVYTGKKRDLNQFDFINHTVPFKT